MNSIIGIGLSLLLSWIIPGWIMLCLMESTVKGAVRAELKRWEKEKQKQ